MRSEQAEVSVIDGGLLAQGKVGDDTNYMIGFRRSTIDLILPYIIPSSVDLSLTTVPSYYDGQFRIDHRLNSNWRLTLSDVGTIDVFAALHEQGHRRRRPTGSTIAPRSIDSPATARYHDGPWTATLALSAILPQFDFDLGAVQHIDVAQPADHAARRSDPHRRRVRRAHEPRAARRRRGADPALGRRRRAAADDGRGRRHRRAATRTTRRRRSRATSGSPISRSGRRSPRTSIRASGSRPGLRLDEFMRNHDTAIQPRGKLEIKLTPKWTARLIAGAYRRPPEYQTESLYANLQAERSTQIDRRASSTSPPRARACRCRRTTPIARDLITYDANRRARQLGPRHDLGRRAARDVSRRTVVRVAVVLVLALDARRLSGRARAPVHVRPAAQPQRRGELEARQVDARRPVPAVLGPAVHAGDRRHLQQRLEHVYPDQRRGELRARADAPRARSPRRLRDCKSGPLALTYFIDVQNVYLDESVVDVLLQLRLHAAGRVQVDSDHPVDRRARRAVKRARARRCSPAARATSIRSGSSRTIGSSRCARRRRTCSRATQSTIDVLVGHVGSAPTEVEPPDSATVVTSPTSLTGTILSGDGRSPRPARPSSIRCAASSASTRPIRCRSSSRSKPTASQALKTVCVGDSADNPTLDGLMVEQRRTAERSERRRSSCRRTSTCRCS